MASCSTCRRMITGDVARLSYHDGLGWKAHHIMCLRQFHTDEADEIVHLREQSFEVLPEGDWLLLPDFLLSPKKDETRPCLAGNDGLASESHG